MPEHIKSWLKRHKDWLPLFCLLLLTAILLNVASVARTIARLNYQPVVAEATTGQPQSKNDNVKKLYDGFSYIQTFDIKAPQISYAGIGVSNFGKATSGKVIVTIASTGGDIIASNSLPSAQISNDNINLIPLSAHFKKSVDYELRVTTQGVLKSQALSVHFEPSPDSYPGGSLSVSSKADHSTITSGNIQFQLLQVPTKRVVLANLLQSPLFFISLAYFLLIFLTWLPPIRRYLTDFLRDRPIIAIEKEVPRREILYSAIGGLILSLFITFPYYTSLNRSDTMGDVQRNLLYRAEGRESLLNNHEIALWDPYSCSGMPLLANIESPILDPFFYIFVVPFGADLGLRLTVTATLAIGFTGVYVLSRRFARLSVWPAILAATIFTLSGFQMMAFATGVFSWTPVGLIPWFVYFLLAAQYRTKLFIAAGVVLSFMILGGNPHMPLFAAITGLIILTTISIQKRSWRPILIFLFSAVTVVSISAIKLVPAVEFIALFDKFHRDPSFIPPLSWAPKMLMDRAQLLIPPWTDANGETISWNELATYVGLLPIAIVVLSLPKLCNKKYLWPWLISTLILFLMIFGMFPWNLMRRMPIIDEMVRTSVRFRSVFALSFGILAGAGLSHLSGKIKRRDLRQFLVMLIALIIGIDLFFFYAPQMRNLFDQPIPEITRHTDFRRVTSGYTNTDTGYWHASYINYLANEGTTDLCNPSMATNRASYTAGADSVDAGNPYRGEIYYLHSGGNPKITKMSFNSIDIQLTEPANDWLVLNQNYFPGWQSTSARPVMPKKGLLAIKTAESDQTIKLRYSPLSYLIGKYTMFAALAILISWITWSRPSTAPIYGKDDGQERDKATKQ